MQKGLLGSSLAACHPPLFEGPVAAWAGTLVLVWLFRHASVRGGAKLWSGAQTGPGVVWPSRFALCVSRLHHFGAKLVGGRPAPAAACSGVEARARLRRRGPSTRSSTASLLCVAQFGQVSSRVEASGHGTRFALSSSLAVMPSHLVSFLVVPARRLATVLHLVPPGLLACSTV